MKKKYLFLLCFILNAAFVFAQAPTKVSINVAHIKADSISGFLILNSVTNNTKKVYLKKEGGTYQATIPLDNSTFIMFSDGKNNIEGVVEPDENITLTYNYDNLKGSFKATGKGSGKFNLLSEKALASKYLDKIKIQVQENAITVDSYFLKVDSVETDLLKKLDKIMFGISSSSYNLLKGEIKGMALQKRYDGVEQLLKTNLVKAKASASEGISEVNRKTIESMDDFTDSYYLSPSYLQAVFSILLKEYENICAVNKTKKCLEEGYEYFNSKLKGQLIIPVKTMYLVSEMNKNINQDDLFALINKTFVGNSTSEFKPYLEREYALFRLGKKAPEFEIEDVLGNKVSLSSFKGKVVYLNFWFSGHTGCQNLFSKLKVVTDQFAGNEDVIFLSVSIDSKELFKRSAKYYGLKGVQVYTEGKGMEHPIISAYKVQTFPASFIIDRKGNFYSTLPPENPLELITLINNATKEQLVMGKTSTRNKN